MSFAAHMIASLKNNKRTRISTYEKVKNFKKGGNIEVHFDKKATPYKIKQIRENLQKENRKKLKRNILLFSIVMLVIIYIIGFVKFL